MAEADVEKIEYVVVTGTDVFGSEIDWFDGEADSAQKAFNRRDELIRLIGEPHSVMERVVFVSETKILAEPSEAQA